MFESIKAFERYLAQVVVGGKLCLDVYFLCVLAVAHRRCPPYA
jgi:hypothetical protein